MHKAEKKIHSLLADPTKQVNHSNGYLTLLWRMIMVERNISITHWDNLVRKWLDTPVAGKMREGKVRSSDRNNLCKEVVRSNMTWNVLLKILRVLNPISVDLTLTIKWRFGAPSSYTINIPIADINKQSQEKGEQTNETK